MTQESTNEEIRQEIRKHQEEAIKLLESGMFHTAIHETRLCIDLAKILSERLIKQSEGAL